LQDDDVAGETCIQNDSRIGLQAIASASLQRDVTRVDRFPALRIVTSQALTVHRHQTFTGAASSPTQAQAQDALATTHIIIAKYFMNPSNPGLCK
jgi:hypothetical protein